MEPEKSSQSAASEESVKYPAAFVRAVGRLLVDEGGYVDNPEDPGGATKFGISQRDYPELDIKALTREAAAAIYFRDWWERYRFSDLSGAIGAKLFDLSVNMGPDHAAKCLQRASRACGRPVVEDGVLGPASLRAIRAVNQLALMAAFRSEAAGYYRAIAALERGRRDDADREFLQGWINRAYE
ncbi:MAG TPA: glycosyl hydrolase 108 family protein [Candidatus Binataceae bacterium]|nr:glycosyl hydrolase 108 family protein [Candidatus Binataceae bacterium]